MPAIRWEHYCGPRVMLQGGRAAVSGQQVGAGQSLFWAGRVCRFSAVVGKGGWPRLQASSSSWTAISSDMSTAKNNAYSLNGWSTKSGKGDAKNSGSRGNNDIDSKDSEDEEQNSSVAVVSDKERERRKKISAANKGKVPWNKGKNMSDEVKARISKRTYEAMQRPDVKARMKKANANRQPHSEEVRKKIREVLRERAKHSKIVIRGQAALVVRAMGDSDDPEERDFAGRKGAEDVIGRLAWRLLHRDFEELYDKWESNSNGFREAVKLRFRVIEEREEKAREKRAALARSKRPAITKSEAVASKMKTALEAQRKLKEAEEKMASVELALAKLRGMKSACEGDEESLALVTEKEDQTVSILAKLMKQVNLLHDAVEPFRDYLPSDDDRHGHGGEEKEPKEKEQELSHQASDMSACKEGGIVNTQTLTQVPWKIMSEQ